MVILLKKNKNLIQMKKIIKNKHKNKINKKIIILIIHSYLIVFYKL